MPVIPKVVFLYDNDALEVRYSDDSRLELSPCGAAMVFHPPSKPGEHPRQRLSQQLHKRTQFVTSEHRQRVLQVLDFRNRFAKRPYLCEDLLNAQDVVSLYASVDRAKWPKSPKQASVDILPDGSRRVTSLDEFASLIVSPHGQDFSVCYLSKVSSEHGALSCPQPLSPPHLPLGSSKLTTKKTLERGGHRKTSEAVVYPFIHEQNENCEHTKNGDTQPDARDGIRLSTNAQENDQNTKIQCQYLEQHNARNTDNQASAFLNENVIIQQHNCQENSQACTAIPHAAFAKQSNLQQLSSDNKTDSPSASDVQSSLNSSTGQVDGKIASSDRFSPLPHEISSISRCSSPDGLRMTIDSDTTLTHDTSDNETIRYIRHRHSSPTQMLSNVDDIQLPFAQLVEMKSSMVQGSYSSFPPGNQQELPFVQNASGESLTSREENAVGISSVFDMAKSSVQPTHSCTNESFNSDLSHSGTLRESEDSMQKSASEKCSVNIALDNQAFRAVSPVRNQYQNNNGTHFPSAVQEDHVLKVPSNQDRGQCVIPGQFKKPESAALPLVAGNPVHSSHLVENKDPCAGKEKRIGIPFDSQTGSCNADQELENKSASKRRYIWTTSHASRNDCPKEWTHALMLALQGEAVKESPTSQRGNERHCMSSLPRPLPLNCPFQHTHRSAAPQTDDEAQNQSSDFSSNVGIFQRGRLKVVLSEGIIYRLIPASGMTVIEVYPGDGSVLISQGAKALFFTHYIPQEGQLEERMYSLKSLPPRCSKDFRPIEKMLKTANRFLHICLNWDKRTNKKYPPCWQKEMVAVVEPLSSSILEECVIDGLGKFSAYTNGRVRIVFDDRTSLNTVSDFSARIGSASKIPNSDLENGMVRLLLPSGNYVLVEKNSTGPYRGYLKIASEWTDWVNASPAERHRFYSRQNQPAMLDQAAKLELKKINCFNYILENTFQPIQQQKQPSNVPSSFDFSTSSHKQLSPRSQFQNDILPPSNASSSTSNKTSLSFLSVKQALAQTSSMIRDIEDFLEENKT